MKHHPLESKLAEAWPLSEWSDVTVLAAVSGGGDSVALLRAMTAVKTRGEGRICAAHLNHHLRPEAGQDERFVADLCNRLQVECVIGNVELNLPGMDPGRGIESAARSARYRFLEQTAGRLGARFVVTAHTADDQAETILHRILRGTGVRGLSGMSRARPLGHATLLRPLLGIRREELLAYLADLEQPCRHDASNADLRFTRNRIRHELLPRLRRHFNPEVVDALLRLGSLAGQSQAVIDELVDERLQRCLLLDGSDEVQIDQGALTGQPQSLIRELLLTLWRRKGWPLQAMGLRKWDDLSALASMSNAKQVFPGGVIVEVAEGRMRLTSPKPR
jgi:tRNA(Ile)-lysidine synthase